MSEIVGKPPVHPALFVVSKIAVAICCLHIPAQAFWLAPPALALPGAKAAALGLFAAGAVLLVVAVSNLGQSIRVGLPSGATELKTNGLYAFSRNPIYLAVYLMCAGSLLYAPRLPNVVAAIVAIGLHHRIVLAEEEFLDRRFGTSWREYRSRVRRYI